MVIRNLRKVTIIGVTSIFILGVIFNSSLVGCKKEDKAMGPVIDVQTPDSVETATFALG
ncbi:hypothetical protein ACFLTP_00195 [Chloroflexota bacterium]